jgi:acyl-CoA thioesterase I
MRKLTLRGFVCVVLCGFAFADGEASVPSAQKVAADTTPASLLRSTAGTAATTTKRIVFLGDSLTVGYGVRPEQSYPSLVAEKIRDEHLPYEVVNAGVSGDTSAGGLRRLDWLLQNKIDLLVIALGANDGLRGLSPKELEANLQAIIDKTKAKNPAARFVVAGMRMPPNLGPDYAGKFQNVFVDVAKKNDAVLIPFLLAHVGGNRDLNQADSIHPTAAGQKVIAETVWETLRPILEQK